MRKRERKYIAPNEASFKRWIAVLTVGELIGLLLCVFLIPFEPDPESVIMGIFYDEIYNKLFWIPLLGGFVFALKHLGKTSLKDFVLGTGGKINKKECLTILGLYAAGFALTYLPYLGHIRLRGLSLGETAFVIVFALLAIGMQTTWEELIYRGLLLRWACKNKVGFTKKALIVSVISAVIFAIGHGSDPLSDIYGAITFASYVFTGLMLFLIDLYFGSLLPGILVHCLNNILVTAVIGGEGAIAPVPTLLVATTPPSAELVLAAKTLLWVPMIVYMILDFRKKKKAASGE